MDKKIKVNKETIEWEENMTVDRILKKMNYTFKMIVVKVNGELVKKENYNTKTIPEGADVQV
ncbi:MAG: sulfur carrier protein ThiS, partial [Candidatus Aminicenantes bacterium]|nr:sulfur carrier protein ThiS [Candidatus Aminicenantes bacterium]